MNDGMTEEKRHESTCISCGLPVQADEETSSGPCDRCTLKAKYKKKPPLLELKKILEQRGIEVNISVTEKG